MRVLIVLSTLFVAACGDTRSFDSMSSDERFAVGSDQVIRGCAAAGNPHERGLQERFDIARGREYLAYVSAHVRSSELDRHISAEALQACLWTEGPTRREAQRLMLSAGSDRHVEMIVESAANPRVYCSQDLTRFFQPHETERLVAACERLGLREIAE